MVDDGSSATIAAARVGAQERIRAAALDSEGDSQHKVLLRIRAPPNVREGVAAFSMLPPLAKMMKQMRIMIARTQDRFINTLFAERTIKTSLAPRWLLTNSLLD